MTTGGQFHGVIKNLNDPTRSLAQAAPDTWAGFADLHRAAAAEGARTAKVKERMAMSIATVKWCDGCISHHAKAAARRGATAQEVAQALGVALLMDGGTASVYGSRARAAYHEFADPNPP